MQNPFTKAESEPTAPDILKDEMIARIAPGREERIFLLLSIFIGIVSDRDAADLSRIPFGEVDELGPGVLRVCVIE